MTDRQRIFSPSAFMTEVLNDNDLFNNITQIELYFIRDSALTREHEDLNGWSDRPRKIKEVYFKPVVIIARLSDKPQKLDLNDFNDKYGEDWGIKFNVNNQCCIKTVHDVNVLTISAEKQVSKNGIEYYPSKTVLYRTNLKMYDSIKQKYNDVPKFEFRKIKVDTFDVDTTENNVNYDEIEI